MFSEIFIAWTHLKALRTFVESVLRYALPTNFQCILVLVMNTKKTKKKIVFQIDWKKQLSQLINCKKQQQQITITKNNNNNNSQTSQKYKN